MFSTSCIYMVPDQNNSIDQDTKNNILKDLKKYDKDNNKPSFHNPGYPDCEDVANSSRTKEEYEKLLDKVKAKYSIKSELDDHNKKAEAEVVQKWSVTHPEVDSEKVKAVIKENQQKDYSSKSHSEDYPNHPRKEAEWNEKLDERAFESGANLAETQAEYDNGYYWPPDEGIYPVPGTPSVKIAPSVSSQDESSDDESSEGSKQAPKDESFEKTFKEDIEKAFREDSEEGSEDESSEGSEKATSSEDETNKRPLSSYSDNNPTKKLDSKQSPLDYVLEKQSTEMPDIVDSDGGD